MCCCFTGVGFKEPWYCGSGGNGGRGLLHNLPHSQRLSNTGRQSMNLPLKNNKILKSTSVDRMIVRKETEYLCK